MKITDVLTSMSTKVTAYTRPLCDRIKTNSHTICMCAGLTIMAGALVDAAVTSSKINETLEPEYIKLEALDNSENRDDKEVAKTYVKIAVKTFSEYAGTIGLFSLGTSLILYANKIQNDRFNEVASKYNTLQGAYKALNVGFSKYRQGVIDKFGKKADMEIRKKLIDDEPSYESAIPEEATDQANASPALYTAWFDELSERFLRNSPGMNIAVLKGFERMLQSNLEVNGYMFLNKVLDELDLPLSEAGQLVGWIYDPNDPSKQDTISFGIDWDEAEREIAAYGKTSSEGILLTFNCTDVIVNAFKEYDRWGRKKAEKREAAVRRSNNLFGA